MAYYVLPSQLKNSPRLEELRAKKAKLAGAIEQLKDDLSEFDADDPTQALLLGEMTQRLEKWKLELAIVTPQLDIETADSDDDVRVKILNQQLQLARKNLELYLEKRKPRVNQESIASLQNEIADIKRSLKED